MVAQLNRGLGDKLLRQSIVEVAGFHRLLYIHYSV